MQLDDGVAPVDEARGRVGKSGSGSHYSDEAFSQIGLMCRGPVLINQGCDFSGICQIAGFFRTVQIDPRESR